jgi:hypothetical protein
MKTENKTNLLLEQKYKAKELAASNGNFVMFSLISQDIRQMERNIKEQSNEKSKSI